VSFRWRFSLLFLLWPFAVLFSYARDLNLLTAGEGTAFQLGVDVERAKRLCLLIVSLMIGLTVSFSGLIGFVGLILPHLARMAFGADHRLLLPTASLGGAIFPDSSRHSGQNDHFSRRACR
jgi:iron complex transport system permease protein